MTATTDTTAPRIIFIEGRPYMTVKDYAALVGFTTAGVLARLHADRRGWPSTTISNVYLIDLIGWFNAPRMKQVERRFLAACLPSIEELANEELANEVK